MTHSTYHNDANALQHHVQSIFFHNSFFWAYAMQRKITPPKVRIHTILWNNKEIVWFLSHSVSNRCYLSYSMIRRYPMVDISRPSDYGSGAPEPGYFIQCIDGIEPMIQKSWCHRIGGICHEVHLTAHIEIPDGSFGEFVTKYLSVNGRLNQIIGELSINCIIKFIRISEILPLFSSRIEILLYWYMMV